NEPRIGRKWGRRPFPDVAEHLAAAEGAVPGGERADVDAACGAAAEVRARRVDGRLAPRVRPLPRRQRAAGSVGLAGGGDLPFGLGRETPAGPARVGLGLEGVHVEDGAVGLEREPAIEGAPLPAVGAAPPVDGRPGVRALAPRPAVVAPQLAPAVA